MVDGRFARGIGSMVLATGLGLAATGAQTPGTVGRSLDTPLGVLVASGPAPSLAFAYSGDVIGYIDPCG